MEVCDVVLRQPPLYFSSSCRTRELQSSSSLVSMGRRFCDEGHLKYYYNCDRSVIRSEKQDVMIKDKGLKKMEKKKKKQLKLLKELSRDLSTFSHIGFGLDCDRTLVDQINGNDISNAAELLLEQLQKIKADNKELQKKRKEEKARLKAAKMGNRLNSCEMSSSSSSESSSDSECGEVINMNSLKRAAQTNQNAHQLLIEDPLLPSPTLSTPIDTLLRSPVPETVAPLPVELSAWVTLEKECCSGTGRSCVNIANVNSLDASICSKKIEVCMGGKCRKTGAGALLEEFQRVVGIEGAVSGCKCMGKCRDGPNVRVLNEFDGGVADKNVGDSSNPLCIGVSMEDVDIIVANFLGENQKQLEFAA
ncbi:hypothetical protein ACJIZ3_016712 [Penstemon smallii]|uniref:Diacylglycerol O-acyltransferase 3, cytosolic n=1 Tax=Penstemon smallii TaxID=265156 RepID=A0ABD3STY3_9LAMI